MPKRKYVHDLWARKLYGNRGIAVHRGVFDSTELLQRLQQDTKLNLHNGCVNTIVWNESGSLLLSGSDDHNLVITDIFQPKPISTVIRTPHTANIISAQFMTGYCDTKLVSCADSTIIYTDINKEDKFSTYSCHTSKVYEVLSIPGDSHSFLSCGEDGTVRWVDTRVHPSCKENNCQKEVIIECDRGVGSISLNPLFPWELAVGSSDSCVRMYDRRMLSTKSVSSNYNSGLSGLFSKFSVPEFEGKSRRISSVKYRPDGKEVLVSFSSDYLYVFDPKADCTATSKTKRLKVGQPSQKWKRAQENEQQQQPVKKFRLRGDWSDTGPRSRPESEATAAATDGSPESQDEAARDRVTSQAALMQRMTFALSRMLNDPGTRLAMQRLGTPGGGSRQNDGFQDEQSNSQAAEGRGTSNDNLQGGENELGFEPQTLETSSASLIQERWRQYRERRLSSRRQEVIEVQTTNDSLADSLLHPHNDNDNESEEEVEIEVEMPQESQEHHSREQIADYLNLEPEPESSQSDIIDTSDQESNDSDEVSVNQDDSNDGTTVTECPNDVENASSVNNSTLVNSEGGKPSTSLQQMFLNLHTTTTNVLESNSSDNLNVQSNADIDDENSANLANETSERNLNSDPTDSNDIDLVSSVSVMEDNDLATAPSTKDNDVTKCDSPSSSNLDDNLENTEDSKRINEESTVSGSTNRSNTEIETIELSENPRRGTTSDTTVDTAENEIERRTSENLEELESSYSNLVEAGVETNLQLRLSEEGANTSSIQIQPDNLPGPMRVVTNPGRSGVDPVTGARRRRIGVSSPPTSSIPLPGCWRPQQEQDGPVPGRSLDSQDSEDGNTNENVDNESNNVVEYESDFSDEDSDEEEESCRTGRTILQPPVAAKFTGHRNVRTLILEGAWWGDNTVLSGSDCGHFFAWDRDTADILLMREADRHVVNRVRPHPFLPIIASSGIDHDVKIWTPTGEESHISTTGEDVGVVTKRNEVMLDETRDTITVPASLMIRMLASLNQIRRGDRQANPL